MAKLLVSVVDRIFISISCLRVFVNHPSFAFLFFLSLYFYFEITSFLY